MINYQSYDGINEAYDDINGAYDDINRAHCDINGACDYINEVYDDINGAYDDMNGACDDNNAAYDDITGDVMISNGAYDDINEAYNDFNEAYDNINQAYDDINGVNDDINGVYDDVNRACAVLFLQYIHAPTPDYKTRDHVQFIIYWLLKVSVTCSDNYTCCHTETEVADQAFYLIKSQYTDTGPTTPSADLITPRAWQGIHCSGVPGVNILV